MNDFEILELAAQQIADDPKPFKDIRDAFRVFARKVRRMKREQHAEFEKQRKERASDLLGDEIPF
jgi:hypothetical protein